MGDVCVLCALKQMLFLFPLVDQRYRLFERDAETACEHFEDDRGISGAKKAEGLGDASGFGGLFLG